MDFRRNGLRDERRRRVLIDETLHAAQAQDASTTDAKNDVVRAPAKRYTDAALASSQMPVTSLIPKRPYMVWLVWFSGALAIASIQLLYRYVYLLADKNLQGSLVALDVNGRGNLACWFASVMLGVSAFGSLLIYQIRRHRADDYRGRYRWWLWLVPLLLTLSVSASTGLHEVLSGVLTSVTGASVAVGGKGWWLLAYGAVFFPIILQLLIEVAPSRLATLFLIKGVGTYLAVAAFELNAIKLPDPVISTLCHSSLLLSAHLSVLITVLSYGRFVYLDAHNKLIERRKWVRWPKWKGKPKAAKPKAEKKTRRTKQVRVDEAHAKFGQEKSQPPSVTLKANSARDDEDDDDSPSDRKMSKAERRRLKKEAQRVERD